MSTNEAQPSTSGESQDTGDQPTESGIPSSTSNHRTSSNARIGEYRLIEQIGEGGMGVVYLADQKEPIRRQVALKIVKPGLDSANIIARFEAERQALAMMEHPNICQVFDAGVADDNRPYFVMELVPGLPITEYCDRWRMPVRERCKLMVTVCRAVQHAHQKGIIHRDIKPSNVLVVDSDEGPVPKVIDFGVAKAIEPHDPQQTDFTLDGHAVGTPLHMSPEQADSANSDIDTRTDVYSLGVLMYELLTGTTPILKQRLRHMDLADVRRAVRSEDPTKPSARIRELKEEQPRVTRDRDTDTKGLMHAVRGDLDQIVLKTISKERDQRYATANGLARDIERHLDSRPIEAVAPSNWYRLRRYATRHKATLATIVFVVGVLFVAAIYSMWKAGEAADALRLAEASGRRLSEQANELQTAFESTEAAREDLSELLYVSDMKLASDAWKDIDTPRVANLLERHEPLPGKPDLRRFSWHYLSRLVDIESIEIDLADGDVETLRFSPDGKWLAAGSRDGKIRIYEYEKLGAPTVFESGQDRVNDLAFSPDGQALVTAGEDGTLRVWEFSQGTLRSIGNPIEAHDGPVTSVVYSTEGDLLLSGGRDYLILRWDANLLAASSQPARDRLLKGPLEGHQRGVQALAVSPDGSMLASASSDATLRIWDVESGKPVKAVDHSPARIVCVAWSHDGKQLAAGDIYGNVILCDIQADTSRVLVRLLDGVESLTFLQGDRWLATGDRGGSIQLWPLAGEQDADHVHGREVYPRWQAHGSRVTALILSRDGNHIVSGSRTGHICRWSAQPDSCRWTIGGVNRLMYDFAFVHGGSHLAVAGEHGLELWDLDDQVLVTRWGEEETPWACVATSPAGDVLVAASAGGETVAWAFPACEELARWPSPDSIAWERIVFAPNGRRFAAVAWSRLEVALIHDLDAPDRRWEVPAKQSKCAAFSPDGEQLAVARMDDALLYRWKTPTGPVQFRGHSNTLSDLAFGRDGDTLATVSHDRKLRLWDVRSATERYTVVAHRDWVRSVGFSPDGWSLVTSGDDGLARLWHTETGQPLLELPNEGHGVLKASFSPDGRRIACHTADHRIVLYDAYGR